MKVLLLGVVGLFLSANSLNNPTPQEVAQRLCSCGQPLADAAQRYQALAQTDRAAYDNHLERASREVQTCLGKNYLASILEPMDKAQQRTFRQALVMNMQQRCPDIAQAVLQMK